MVLVNGGFLHCTDIKKFFSESDKKKLARAISKNQVSDPGPSWLSCLNSYGFELQSFAYAKKLFKS